MKADSKKAAPRKTAPKKAAPRKAAPKAAPRKAAPRKASPQGDATASEQISRYIGGLPDWRGKMLARIRKVFRDADPAMVEEWKWMGSPVWSRSGLIAVANAHRDKVKVTFARGAGLPDPHKVFNAGLGGNTWRAIDLHEGDELDEPALKALIRSAVRHNVSRSKT
jgi:hypothetical protein